MNLDNRRLNHVKSLSQIILNQLGLLRLFTHQNRSGWNHRASSVAIGKPVNSPSIISSQLAIVVTITNQSAKTGDSPYWAQPKESRTHGPVAAILNPFMADNIDISPNQPYPTIQNTGRWTFLTRSSASQRWPLSHSHILKAPAGRPKENHSSFLLLARCSGSLGRCTRMISDDQCWRWLGLVVMLSATAEKLNSDGRISVATWEFRVEPGFFFAKFRGWSAPFHLAYLRRCSHCHSTKGVKHPGG